MKNDYPNLFVSEIFFDSLDKKMDEVSSYSLLDIDNYSKRKSFDRIRELFLSGNIYTDIKKETIAKYRNNLNGTIIDNKHLILKSIWKAKANAHTRELVLEKNIEDCKLSNFCFFIDKNHEDCENLSQIEGKIIVGHDFLNSPFYLEQTFAGELTDKNINQVNKIKHPCGSMLIIDQYLFDQNKIPDLINFLEKIISPKLSKPFELDILIGTDEYNEVDIKNKYDKILNAFSNKISLHIVNDKSAFVNKKEKGKESDRYFVTNYSTISIGHPFDRKTNISCNFYPSNNSIEGIISSYSIWKEKIIFAKKRIESAPEKSGKYYVKWKSDDIKHSIFELV